MKLIILDRDGVINDDSDDYIKSPDEWHAIPGSLEAIAKLNQAGYTVIVVSNQAGVAKGYFTLEMLQKINEKMLNSVEKAGGKIDKIYFCPHEDKDNCHCRKPKPGMFKQVAKDYQVDLKDIYYIGDKFKDYLAAKAAGCKFILVKTGYGKEMLQKHSELQEKALIADDLSQAVLHILVEITPTMN